MMCDFHIHHTIKIGTAKIIIITETGATSLRCDYNRLETFFGNDEKSPSSFHPQSHAHIVAGSVTTEKRGAKGEKIIKTE